MPFTPFHFGPGLFLKAIGSRYFSWGAFVATQVVIDGETLYFMLQRAYPVHRTLHTLLGATLAGLATALALIACKALRFGGWPRAADSLRRRGAWASSELSTLGILTGGLIGGASHPLLDGLMHRDVHPFAPWSSANPLLHLVRVGTLHLGCVTLGLIGVVGLGLEVFRGNKAG